MNTRNTVLFALAAPLALLLAGCADAGPTAGPPSAALPPSADEAAFDETTGAIQGLVVTVEYQPVAGADLMLMPGGRTTQSAADGTFTFSFVDEDTYTLHAARLGFEAAQVRLEVRAGEVARPDVTLEDLPVLNPRTQVFPYTGFLECRWASFGSGVCGSTGVCLDECITTSEVATMVWGRDQNEMLFQLQDEDWEEIVIEVQWQASTMATSPKMRVLFSYDGRPGNHEFGSSNPELSPIKWHFVRGEPGQNARLPADTPPEPSTDLTLRIWLAVGANLLGAPSQDPAGVAYETRFDLFVTAFYSQRAPEGYSAFPDD